MPLQTQCGLGEGLEGAAFLGGNQNFGTQLLLQPQRHISILLCIPVIIDAGEAHRCCSSFCRQHPDQPKAGRCFHPWESDLETLLCPEGWCGDQDPKVDLLHFGFKMGKQSRPLKFRLLFQNMSQQQIAYPIPAPQPTAAESQPGAVLSLSREKSQIFMGEDLGSTGGTGPMPHLYTLCPELASKVEYRPKYCIFPDTSNLHPF